MPHSAPNFGCCDSAGSSCGYVSTCVDYNTRNTPQVGAGLFLQGDDFYCGSDAPYCETVVLYGQEYTSGGTYSFFSYSCRTKKGTTITAFQHTTEDTTQDNAMSPSSTTSTDGSPQSTAEPNSAISSSSTAAAATPSAPQDLSEGAQIGIGVGVGIFAAVALVAALLWFRHRSRARSAGQMDAKSHLHDIDYYEGTPAELGDHSLGFDRKGSLQELGCGSDHIRAELTSSSRAELASSSRCYELSGDRL